MGGEKYEIGDRVMIRGNTIGTSLPRYLEGSPMTIKGAERYAIMMAKNRFEYRCGCWRN